MVASGILGFGPDTLRLLAGYEERAEVPTLAGRLAAIVLEAGAETLQVQWRLANAEIRAAEDVLAAERLLAEGRAAEAAYRFPDALPDALALAASRGDWSAERLASVNDRLRTAAIPPFPLSGRDLVEIGYRPGEALGRELKRLERTWIDSGFSLSREELLGAARGP
jgi:poly(A) polymerase